MHTPTDVETGLRSNNFFGIKPDKKGQAFVTSWTTEYNKDHKLESKLQPFAGTFCIPEKKYELQIIVLHF